MPRLENQVALITGAASGIGEGTVRKYVAEGAKVVIADIQDERGGALAEELGPGTTFVHTNVAVEDDVARAVSVAVERWGRLDVIFNNAGFGGASGPIEDLDMNAYDDTMNVLLEKTKGNLTPEEEGSLKQAISELGEVYIARVQQFQEETIRQAGQNLNLH